MLRRTKERSTANTTDISKPTSSKLKKLESDAQNVRRPAQISGLTVTADAAKTGSDKIDDHDVLERLVLGGQTSFVANLEREVVVEEVGILDKEERTPAWEDEEDEVDTRNVEEGTVLTRKSGTVFSQKRKSSFEKVVGTTPSWAKLRAKKRCSSEAEDNKDDDDDDDDDEEGRFLRRTGDYLTTSDSLPASYLNIKKVTNANKEQPSARMSAMEFHPTSQVMLTAGEDESLHIFQVDGVKNPKIQSIAVEKYPILCAHFSADGSEVIMSSRSRWYYVYDMLAGKMDRISFLREHGERQPLTRFAVSPDGKFIAFQGLYGFIHLVSAKNKELLSTLKMNGPVKSLAFSGDGTRLFSFGDDGEVYVWDMNTRDCIHKFVDEGCIQGTTISVSRNGQYIACGSHSGVVNVYNEQCLTELRPKPVKAVMNLRTSVTASRFNGTGEILGVASVHAQNAAKLIHLPDCRIFPNFPVSTNDIGLVTLLDFSPNSGYMAVGNRRGKALLYRLGHYKNY